MSIILTILIGFIVGLFARAFMPGSDIMGFIMTTLLGIGGALIGKYIGQAFGLYHDHETAGFFMSIVGAMILLFLYKRFVRKDTYS
ncbi:MAG: GlsB/YeaQ/YmgE family stress response membrane protein [Candidatus Protochlamydia sp.]|nr:GlsB/YeaQ/YmgE family stress response membrane protein [Candidatus Protochlamydia sp.]